jgi:dipeptidyl aminopeptidase/acylaminoacyl peptidase
MKRRSFLATGLGAVAALPISHAPGSAGCSATLSDEGRIFAYAWIAHGQAREEGIVAINPADGTWRMITQQGNPAARVSPDGRSIVYSSAGSGDEAKKGLWICDTKGEDDSKRVSDLVGRVFWTPSSQGMIVSRGIQPGLGFETLRMKLDGSDPVKLPIPEAGLVIECSRDAEWLLTYVNSGRGEVPLRVSVLRPDGRDQRDLSAKDGSEYRHRFSPDGRKILYFRQAGGSANGPKPELWTMNRDGEERHLLIAPRDDAAPHEARWSPDGQRIVDKWFGIVDNRPDATSDKSIVEIRDADGKNPRAVPFPRPSGMKFLDWR